MAVLIRYFQIQFVVLFFLLCENKKDLSCINTFCRTETVKVKESTRVTATLSTSINSVFTELPVEIRWDYPVILYSTVSFDSTVPVATD